MDQADDKKRKKTESSTTSNDDREHRNSNESESVFVNNNNNNNDVVNNNEVEQILELMVARSRGEVSSEQVEHAVSSLLQKQQQVDGSNKNNNNRSRRLPIPVPPKPNVDNTINNSMNINKDTDNYDDFDNDNPQKHNEDDNTGSGIARPSKKQKLGNDIQIASDNKSSSSTTTTTTEKSKDGNIDMDTKTNTQNNNNNENEMTVSLDSIPLGKEGARMFKTFGDGPCPNPQAISLALLATRRYLQTAVRDARAWRRHAKRELIKAKQHLDFKTNTKTKNTNSHSGESQQQEADAFYMYRAMGKYDKLSYDPKCGFDLEQLRQLFPEEMHAYCRWNRMHQDASANENEGSTESTSKNKKSGNNSQQNNPDADNEDDDDDDDDDDAMNEEGGNLDNDNQKSEKGKEEGSAIKKATGDENSENGGHLHRRVANFNVRTEEMNSKTYLEFAETRKGSFLPRRRATRQEREFRRKNQQRGGRKTGGTWYGLHLYQIKFLHWIGFDPGSDLPPPKENVTEALAFLGHDYMGRIIERAVLNRNSEDNEEKKGDGDEEEDGRPINALGEKLELKSGQQLTVEDIERVLEDSSIRPMALFSSPSCLPSSRSKKKSKTGRKENNENDEVDATAAAQLYFGPGFENRLEMEMDELLSNMKNKGMTEEEKEIRQREDELFAELAKPPRSLEYLNEITTQEEPNDAKEVREEQEGQEDKQEQEKVTVGSKLEGDEEGPRPDGDALGE